MNKAVKVLDHGLIRLIDSMGDDLSIVRKCKKYFKSLGIARHRAMHRDKKERIKVTEPNGKTYVWKFDT